MPRRLLLTIFIALAVLAAACGGGSEEADSAPSSTPDRSEPAEDPSAGTAVGGDPSEGGGAGSLDDVEAATIQIVAEGSFIDPEFGQQVNAAGAGSGFIIDPSGIAVTNNHVVTGSAILQVYVGGSDSPMNARVLGASECSDLAVIQIDGDDFPSLEWAEEDAKTGLDVYAAGFPLGDPEFTLTRGIVSKAATDGETNWASVDGVLEHDATINPGNSGGPLVDEEGRVVGVNYAGNSETRQQFAITAPLAQRVVEQLQEGEDVESIGINGQAVVSDDETISGVWVASVKSGSPADNTGIEAGDVITKIEDLVLATDGTMKDYCDVLRSRSADDTLDVEVLRFETSEILEGQLNGRELAVSTSFGNELAGTTETDETAEATYSDYTSISDDTGAIQVDVPVEWSDVDGAPFSRDGVQFSDVRAASDLNAFQTSWTTPGVIVTASSQFAQSGNELTLLEELKPDLESQCTYQGRQPYEDPAYTGQFDLYTECGGVGASYVVIAVVPPDRSFVIRVQVQANSDRDFDVLDRVIDTFVVTGQV